MAIYQQLSPTKKARVVSLRREQFTFAQIGMHLGINASSACHAWHKYNERENFYAKTPGRGRPRLLGIREHRKACWLIRSGRAETAADVQRDRFQDVSPRTMWHILSQEGLHGRHKHKVPFMSKRHQKKRREFGRRHSEWE
jgi:transposase